MILSQEIHICVRFAKYRMLRLQPSASPESSVWKLWQTGYHTLSVLFADAAGPGELDFILMFFLVSKQAISHTFQKTKLKIEKVQFVGKTFPKREISPIQYGRVGVYDRTLTLNY